MTYLRVRNFWEYQNADVWKKAQENKGGHRHPPWCKLYVRHDFELMAEKPIVRLVFYELLKLATVSGNVIPNDISTIAKAISTPSQDTLKAIDRLLKGGWLSETSSPRRSRKILAQKQIEKEKKISKSSTSTNGHYAIPEIELAKLLVELTDKDDRTEQTIRGIARKQKLPQAAFMYARDCATGPGVVSRTKVAVAALKGWSA